MTTPSLFDPEPTQPPDAALQRSRPRARMARATDPETSHQAAKRAEASGKLEANRKLILIVVRSRPGLTSDEIAKAAGLDRVEVARRMCELDGTAKVKPNSLPFPRPIRRGPARKSEVSGNSGVTWWPVEATK